MHIKKINRFLNLLSAICICSGLGLFIIDTYGLFKTLRNPDVFKEQNVRFKGDITLEYTSVMNQIIRRHNESDKEFALRLNKVIQKGIAHIIWERMDANKYYQKIPIWENFILFSLSYSPFFDDYERYHFSDYKKSLERGIGICGDAAAILSGILEDNNIDTRIISMKGHVITEVLIEKKNDIRWLFDPDFGVVIPHNLKTLMENPGIVEKYYFAEGYSIKEVNDLVKIYSSQIYVFDNVKDFGPKKYAVEYISYLLKWLIPLLLILSGIFFFIYGLRNKNRYRKLQETH